RTTASASLRCQKARAPRRMRAGRRRDSEMIAVAIQRRRWLWVAVGAAAVLALAVPARRWVHTLRGRIPSVQWPADTPESVGPQTAKLEQLWRALEPRKTAALLVARRGKLIAEHYAGIEANWPRGVSAAA